MPAVAQTAVAGGPLPRTAARPDRSERSLIRGALAGRESDLELLFRRHWPRAYRAAFLIVHDHAAAEDIAQEAFVAAIRRLDRFDRRRPFAPWLGAIVANRAIDWVRARAARREIADSFPGETADSFPGVIADSFPGRTADSFPGWTAAPDPPLGPYSEEVLAALAALSCEHRAVVVMRHVLDYTPGEIARALKLPRGTVNSRLRRGLDALESRLREAERR
jgi:RNA polymerase sigma-70 factor (ECF subfamily)